MSPDTVGEYVRDLFIVLAVSLLLSWIIAFFVPILVTPQPLPSVLLAIVSFMAFKEFITLTPNRQQDRWAFLWAYVAIPLQYFWVVQAWYGMFIIFIPVYLFLLLPTRLVLSGHPKGFLNSTSTLHWGLMTTVFSLSHMAYLLVLPDYIEGDRIITGASLLFLLVFLTQMNDVAQFVWGKTLGQRKILPLVSPNKTWEGFLGGAVTTLLVSLLLTPLFTPLDLPRAALVGLEIGIFGFIGDVVMSAVKRDIGVKDTGTLLPGHGGILDRLDSLTFTAPLYFHTLYYFYY
jgi:phosphatidate cytidylyltransferase